MYQGLPAMHYATAQPRGYLTLTGKHTIKMYTRWFTTTIFSAKQCCNVGTIQNNVAMLCCPCTTFYGATSETSYTRHYFQITDCLKFYYFHFFIVVNYMFELVVKITWWPITWMNCFHISPLIFEHIYFIKDFWIKTLNFGHLILLFVHYLFSSA